MTNSKRYSEQRTSKPDVNSLVYGKVPPQATDLERAVLGAVLLEKERLDEVLEIIPNEECLYVDAHQKIYAAIRRMYTKGMPVDLLTIIEELRKSNELDVVGGPYFLTQLTSDVVSSAHIDAHARIIMEKYMQRKLIQIAGTTINDAYQDTTDPFDLVDKISEELNVITSQTAKKSVRHISDPLMDMMFKLEEQKYSDSDFNGVDTGFYDLNAITRGWQKKDLIILAARPSIGKTAYSLALAMNAAFSGTPTALFNLEMDAERITQRMMSARSGVPLERLKHPKSLTEADNIALQKAFREIKEAPIHIDDSAGLTIVELRAKARKLKSKFNIELLIIDYLQLMSSTEKGGNREQEISKISRELKKLAKDLDISIIALSQLNRSVENSPNKEPGLADLRESGAIEQDADLVMFLWKPGEEYLKKYPQYAGLMLLLVRKNRDGACEDIGLIFNKEIQRWTGKETYDQFQAVYTKIPAASVEAAYSRVLGERNNNDEFEEMPF